MARPAPAASSTSSAGGPPKPHEIRFEGGSFGRVQTGIDLSGKLNDSGTVTGRITGIVRDADSQYDYVRERRVAISPALTIHPSDDTTLTLLANYQNDPLGGFYNFVPATRTVIDSRLGKIHSNFFGGDPNFDSFKREQAAIGYQFEHRFNDVFTVRQNYRFQNIRTDFHALSIQSIAADGRTASRILTSSADFANTSALDNQLQATVDTGPLHHTLLAGLEWDRGESSRKLVNQTTGVPTLDLFAPRYFRTFALPTVNPATATTEQSQDQIGGYLQDQVTIGKLHLNAAVRQDRATTSTFTRSTSARVDQADSATTWRAGALYLFDSGVAPYASYSTSFLPNSGTSAPQRGSTPFAPTTGDQYEVGVKFQPNGSNSFLQLAGFQITQQNVLTRDQLYTLYSIAQGEIRSRGVELEGRASLSDNLDLIGTYSYIDAVITKTNNAGTSPGNRVPAVPRHLASAWANYRFTSGPLTGLSLGGGARLVSQTAGDEANSFRVPGFALFDAAVSYDMSAWGGYLRGKELTLNASNLLDKEYVSSCSSTTACYFGTRRTILAGLRLNW